jgi:2-C-methyl-D-erythritol 2,4-cyclodiphosphate synthase
VISGWWCINTSYQSALGPSDADVYCMQSVMLYWRTSLGDIGVHFPDTSAEFKNIDSKILCNVLMTLYQKKVSRCKFDTTLPAVT